MANTFLCDQISKLEEIINNLTDAIIALGDPLVQEYTLDTGQTRQTVKKADLEQLKNTLQSYWNMHATLCARCGGSGVTRVFPF